MISLTPNLPLPGAISVDTKEIGGHSGSTTVTAHLLIETAITGDITIEKGGKVTVEGIITGDVTNRGELIVENEGEIKGSLYHYGKLTFKGSLSQGGLYLKTGSQSEMDSQKMSQIQTISSEPNAFVKMKSGGGFNVNR